MKLIDLTEGLNNSPIIDWDALFIQMNDDTLDEIGRKASSHVCRSVGLIEAPDDGIYDGLHSTNIVTLVDSNGPISQYQPFEVTKTLRSGPTSFPVKVCVRNNLACVV